MNIFRRFSRSSAPDTDISSLMPVLVPMSLALPTGSLAPVPLADTGFGVTALTGDSVYMSVSLAAEIRDEGEQWQSVAMRNLVRRDKGFPFTQERRRDDGRLILLTARHEDGLGTSRLLLQDTLSARFPSGYRVALPDRSIGFALSNDIGEAEEQEIRQQIRICYERATIPGSPRLFEPVSLLL